MEAHTSPLAKAIEQFQGKVLPLSIFNQLLSILDKVEDSKHAVQLLDAITHSISEVSLSSSSTASETATITLNISNTLTRDWLISIADQYTLKLHGHYTGPTPTSGVVTAYPYDDNNGTITITSEDWSNLTIASNASPYYTVNIAGDPWVVRNPYNTLSSGAEISKAEKVNNNSNKK